MTSGMNAAAGRLARNVLATAAEAGRREGRTDEAVAEAVGALRRAAAFFACEEGRLAARALRSSRIPLEERKSLLAAIAEEELAGGNALPREVSVLLETLSAARALALLPAVARRAAAVADAFTDVARVEVRAAMALPEASVSRIRAAMRKALARPVRVEVIEDPEVMAGVVVKAGDRVWDGSLPGRLRRAAQALT